MQKHTKGGEKTQMQCQLSAYIKKTYEARTQEIIPWKFNF